MLTRYCQTGIDIDGILRGKIMQKAKFLASARENVGFGFCSFVHPALG